LTENFGRDWEGETRHEDMLDNQYDDRVSKPRLTMGAALISINSFEDKYFVRILVWKPVPLLVFVEMYHSILGEVVGVNNISVYQISLVNTCGITKSKRPVSDRNSKRFPDTAKMFYKFYVTVMNDCVLT
jgi:hypothetical protein